MSWCPKCRVEYCEGYKICSDCGVELVEQLEPIVKEVIEYHNEAFLMSVSDDMEANVIESVLKPEGIPSLRKYKEAGSYMKVYMGFSNTGVDLYVPEGLLKRAKEIISANKGIELQVEEADKIDSTLVGSYQIKRRIRAWIILSFFLIPIVFAILAALYIFLYKLLRR